MRVHGGGIGWLALQEKGTWAGIHDRESFKMFLSRSRCPRRRGKVDGGFVFPAD